jgi:hypothetical protein
LTTARRHATFKMLQSARHTPGGARDMLLLPVALGMIAAHAAAWLIVGGMRTPRTGRTLQT